jgi:hypothetical protein
MLHTICIHDTAFGEPTEMTPSAVATAIEELVVQLRSDADQLLAASARNISRVNPLRRQAAALTKQARGLRLRAAQEQHAKKSAWAI